MVVAKVVMSAESWLPPVLEWRSRADTGTIANSGEKGSVLAALEVAPQGATGDRQHHVVHG